MLRTPQFYLPWPMYVLTASAGLMVIMRMLLIAKEQAHWEAGFIPVMLLALFNTLGRFGSGVISDRLGRTSTMVLAFALQAINLFFFAQRYQPDVACPGDLAGGVVLRHDLHLDARSNGRLLRSAQHGRQLRTGLYRVRCGRCLWLFAGGRVRDLFGSFDLAYLICAGMLLAAAVLAFARSPQAREAQPESDRARRLDAPARAAWRYAWN